MFKPIMLVNFNYIIGFAKQAQQIGIDKWQNISASLILLGSSAWACDLVIAEVGSKLRRVDVSDNSLKYMCLGC